MKKTIDFDDIKEAFGKAKKDIGKVNIALIGKTGVGKSTLINAVFGENLAKTGVGKPVTQNCREYTKEGSFFNLIDTKGFELENYDEILNQMKGLIEARKTQDPATHIHLAWFCINSVGNRFEDAEIHFVNELGAMIPVIVVLTQSINANKDLYESIVLHAPNVKQVVRVLAQDYEVDGVGVKKAYGLDTLTEASTEVIPEAFREAFAAAQKVNWNLKEKQSLNVIHASSALAATACAVPVPLTDAAMLVPIQITMLAKISHIMGLESSKEYLGALVSAAGGVVGAVYAGRWIFTSIMKSLPGAGSLIGAAVGAATAAAVTEAMGNAFLSTLLYVFKNGLDPTAEVIGSIFTAQLKKQKIK